jgi:hypothetical protein
MLTSIHEDIESVGRPDRSRSIGHSSCKVNLICLGKASSSDVVDTFEGLLVSKRHLLRQILFLYFCKLLGNSLQKMLNVDIVRVIVCLSMEKIGCFKGLHIGPAIYDPLGNINVLSSFELFFLGKLNSAVYYPYIRLKSGKSISWSLILPVFNQELDICKWSIELRLRPIISLSLDFFLPLKLKLQDRSLDFSTLILNLSIIERISKPFLELLLFERNRLGSVDGIEV